MNQFNIINNILQINFLVSLLNFCSVYIFLFLLVCEIGRKSDLLIIIYNLLLKRIYKKLKKYFLKQFFSLWGENVQVKVYD